MININIYPELLKCAYDIDTLHFQKLEVMTIQSKRFIEMKHGCYIMTSDGDLEIYITEKLYRKSLVFSSVVLSSNFKSNVRSVSNELIKGLIEDQLDAEIFLGYSNYEESSYKCEEIA